MKFRLLLLATFISIGTASVAFAGTPDGQPFPTCITGGDIQCVMGPGSHGGSSDSVGMERIEVTSPSNGNVPVKLTLEAALDVINQIPAPKPGDNDIFDHGLKMLYVRTIYQELEKTAVGHNPAPSVDLSAKQRFDLLTARISETKAALKQLERERKLAKKQLRAKK